MNAGIDREMAVPYATRPAPVFWLAAAAILLAAIYVSGFKPIGISADILNYEILYNISAITDWRSIFSAGDFGYFALAKLAAYFGCSFDSFALIIAAITCILLSAVVAKLDTNRPILIAIYGSYLFWLHEYTQIRIAAAIALGLFAIYVCRPTVRWPLLLVATLLHNSFILFVIAYALVKIRRVDVLIGLVALFLFFALGPLAAFRIDLLQRVLNYRDLASAGQFANINLFSLMPIVQIFGIGCALLSFRKLQVVAKEELVLSIVGVVAFYALSSVPVLAFRTYELFMPFFVILLSRLWGISVISRAVILVWIVLGIRSSFLTPDSVVIL